MSEAYDLKLLLSPPYDRARPNNHVFFPGDQVTGTVLFRLLKEKEISSIYVQFKGKCKTTVGSGKHARHWKKETFSFTQTVLKGPVTMQPDVYEYSFAFQFPETFNVPAGTFNEELPQFSKAGVLPLPPTCSDYDSAGDCSVHYTVRVRVPRNFLDWKDKVRLRFSSYRSEPSPDPMAIIAKSLDHDHEHFKIGEAGLPRALSKREAMKNTFMPHAEDVATINFSLVAKAPTAIVIGRMYPLEVTLTTLSSEGNTDVMPNFLLKSLTLNLKQKTSVRAPSLLTDHTAVIDDTHLMLSTISLDTLLPLNASKEFTNLFNWDNASTVAPTFISGAVRVSYGLELKAVVVSLGEEFRFKIHWPDVFIHSSRMEPGIEDAIRSIEDGILEVSEGGDDERPPLYEVGELPPTYNADDRNRYYP